MTNSNTINFSISVVSSGAGETPSYFGGQVTFTVTGDSGQYADGSYWTTGSVTDMSPAFEAGATRTLTDTSTVQADSHGWMVNPGNADAFKTGDLSTLALRQAANYGTGANAVAQSYDGYVATNNLGYDANLRPSLPVSSGTLVKANSKLTDVSTTARPAVDYMAVLTLVDEAPASGAIRPPISRSDKTPIINVSTLDISRLRNLDVSGFTNPAPTYAKAMEWLDRTITHQSTYNVLSRNIVAPNGSTAGGAGTDGDPYFGTIADQFSRIMLAMHTNAYTSDQKTELAIQIGVLAGDIAARVNEGGIFQANGGHSHGRLPVLAFAAELFDSAYLRTACDVVASGSISNVIESGQSVYGDLGQLHYITQDMIDATAAGSYPYPQASLGYPAWSSQYAVDTSNLAGNILGNAATGDDASGVSNGASYQAIVGKSLPGFSLALRLMQGVSPSMPQLYHDYADRWIGFEVDDLYAFPTSTLVKHSTNLISDWVREAYAEFSPLIHVWTPEIIVGFLGQSNSEYIMASSSFYNHADISRPTIDSENAIYVGANPGAAGTIIERAVTSTTVSERTVNVSMAVWSNWLNYIAPGREWRFIDLSEAGTGRSEIQDDADAGRDWTHTQALVDYTETNHGSFDAVLEWWYANDAVSLESAGFLPEWAPLYLGERSNGSAFTLGSVNPDSTRNPSSVVDHCFWDVTANPYEKGRGLFSQQTKWTFVQNHWKDSRKARQDGINAFHADARVQEFAEPIGAWGIPYAHDGSHALLDDPDGQVYMAWTFAPSLARLAGVEILNPTVHEITFAGDGSYADVVVNLPNGGNLTTIRAAEGRAAAATPLPHQQPVSGFEIRRAGTTEDQRQPVFKTTETSYPIAYRGAVVVQDAGSGSPRRGIIRITPEQAFATGDMVYPLWMGATSPETPGGDPNASAEKIWLDYPVENIPALVDADALYKYPGIAVDPFSDPGTRS